MHRCNRLVRTCVRVSREANHDWMIKAVVVLFLFFFLSTNLLITIHKYNSISSTDNSAKVRLIELALNQTDSSTPASLPMTLLINRLGSLEFLYTHTFLKVQVNHYQQDGIRRRRGERGNKNEPKKDLGVGINQCQHLYVQSFPCK